MRELVIFLLTIVSIQANTFGQETYDVCQNALEICPGQSYNLNNINASRTFCANCEDDFNFCFSSDNSIWLKFTTNATGGALQVDFSNLNFEVNAGQDNELQAALIEATTPCAANTYTQIGSCHSNETNNFSLTAAGLLPSTVYYIVIDGDNNGAGITDPAECAFDLIINGQAVDRPVPTSSVAPDNNPVCENDIVTFTCSLTDCPDSIGFTWYINGDIAAQTTNAFFQTTSLQNGDVVSVSNECYASCPVTVQSSSVPMVVNSVSVDAGPDMTISSGETVQLNGTTTATTYNWSPPFLVSDPATLTPFTTPTETTTFALTAEDNGCSSTDYVTITIDDSLDIPDTFSPNGDNVNDSWEIDGLEQYPDNLMSIYTRWGQKVFQTTAYSKFKMWDGENHSEGVYYYILELNDADNTQYSGTITLIR